MFPEVENIDYAYWANSLENEDVVCLDVRSYEDYASGHIPGAQNLDVVKVDLSEHLSKLDKEASYMIYCTNGIRSQAAVRIMKAYKFKKLYHLEDGLVSYEGPLVALGT